MKKIILLTLLFMGLGYATKYEVVHLKRGSSLNVRQIPSIKRSAIVGRIAANTTGISIYECTELKDGSEWCYIKAPHGGSHIEGWVNSYYLAKMSKKDRTSKVHIQNFLHNFYMADEENFLDKLQVFYKFPMQQYLWSKNVTLMQLRQKKVRFYKKWPTRDYRLTYMKILKRKPNYIDVQTTVRWKLKGHGDYEAGKDIQKLRLIPTGNTFKVSALKYLKHIVYPKPKPVVEQNATTVVSNELNNTEALATATTEVLPSEQYYIKSGSFFATINPNYLASISKNGFSYLIQKVRQGDKVIRRVFIGPFNSAMEATEALSVVRAKINEYAYIQRDINH